MEEGRLEEPSNAGPLDVVLERPLLGENAAVREGNGGDIPSEDLFSRAPIGSRNTVGGVGRVGRPVD